MEKGKKESVTTKLLCTDAKVNFYTGLPDLETKQRPQNRQSERIRLPPRRKTLLVDEFV